MSSFSRYAQGGRLAKVQAGAGGLPTSCGVAVPNRFSPGVVPGARLRSKA